MTLFNDVFERKELKYCLSALQYHCVYMAMSKRMIPDEFGFSQVRSLYFDTPNYELIEHSLDKPFYKEKLRVRSYGAPQEDSPVFIEIKKKLAGIVYKRRISMTLAASNAYLGGMSYQRACARYPLAEEAALEPSSVQKSNQIAQEINFFLEHYAPLVPSMLTVCDRCAYAAADGSDLRITFDENITTSAYAHDLLQADRCLPLLDPGDVLMEVKNMGPLPAWLTDALSAAAAYPCSFSKYGAAYKAASPYLARLKERNQNCA